MKRRLPMRNPKSDMLYPRPKAGCEAVAVLAWRRWQSMKRGSSFPWAACPVAGSLLAFLLLMAGVARACAQDQFRLDWWAVNAGGATSSDAQFAVSGTLGQRGVGVMSGGAFMLVGGVWAAIEPPAPTAPRIGAQLSGAKVVLSWPVSEQGCTLETTGNLSDPNSWTTLSVIPVVAGSQNTVTIPIQIGPHFYRLRRQ